MGIWNFAFPLDLIFHLSAFALLLRQRFVVDFEEGLRGDPLRRLAFGIVHSFDETDGRLKEFSPEFYLCLCGSPGHGLSTGVASGYQNSLTAQRLKSSI